MTDSGASDAIIVAGRGVILSAVAFCLLVGGAACLLIWTTTAVLHRQAELLERATTCETARQIDALQGLRAAIEMHAQPKKVIGP